MHANYVTSRLNSYQEKLISQMDKISRLGLFAAVLFAAVLMFNINHAMASTDICDEAVAIEPTSIEIRRPLQLPLREAPTSPDGDVAIAQCRSRYDKNPNALNSYYLARALHLKMAQLNTQAAADKFRPEILEYLLPAFEAEIPEALYFTAVMRSTSYFYQRHMDCGLDNLPHACFAKAAEAGYKPARWHAASWPGDDSARYLQELIAEGDERAIRRRYTQTSRAKYDWRVADSQWHMDWASESKRADALDKYLDVQNELIELSKRLIDIGDTEVMLDLADIVVLDQIKGVPSEQLLGWLSPWFGKSSGIAETLAVIAQARQMIGSGVPEQSSVLVERAGQQGHPISALADLRWGLNERKTPISRSEAIRQLRSIEQGLEAFSGPRSNRRRDSRRQNSRRQKEDPQSFSGLRTYWVIMAKAQLREMLAPLLFEEATRLVQASPDGVPPPEAIELYKSAKKYGVQKASLALAYFYKEGKGLPKSVDWAKANFFIASNCRPVPNPGVADCSEKLRTEAIEQHQNIARAQYGPSSKEALAALGLMLVVVGELAANSNYQPASTGWEQPPMNMLEMNLWLQ